MSSVRYAIYYTPPPDSPLAAFGADVVGYDCFYRKDVPQRPIDGVEPQILALTTVEPRRYGFHATLVAPFHLGQGTEDDLQAAFAAFAGEHAPVRVGPLAPVIMMDRFAALIPARSHAGIEAFAAACVEAFAPLRAPLSQADRERRLAAGLTPRQAELLERWGYPYVLEEFRFHMTLAGPIPAAQQPAFKDGFARAFDGLARDHLELDAISLMRQDDRASRFYVLARKRLSSKR